MRELGFNCCEIGDEGVAALVENLGKDDFEALEQLHLHQCGLTDAGCAQLVSALDTGGLPSFTSINGIGSGPDSNPGASKVACQAVGDAMKRARARRLRGVE